MADDRDELDASDWLARQFGEEPEPAPAPPVEPAPPTTPVPPVAPEPFPVTPAYQPPSPPPVLPAYPAPALGVPPAPAVPPVAPSYPPVANEPPAYQPPADQPPAYQPPPFSPPPLVTPPQQPPAAPAADAPFQWGLTPGAPVTPPAEPVAPVMPPAPQFDAPAYTPAPVPAYEPPPVGVTPPAAPLPPAYVPPPAALPPQEPPTVAFPPAAASAAAPTAPVDDAPQWFAAPVDPALDGVTEVFEAELVGGAPPEGEGPAASAIDSLFGENQFRDFSGEPLIAPPPPRGPSEGKPPKGQRAPIPRTQKILMWIAGSLVAVLALLALFLLGTRLSAVVGPAPAVAPTPSATPSPSATAFALGPVAPGEHQWDDLLGGECITPFESAWEDRYTVVACTTPHQAQMIYKGTFPDALTVEYPGLEELQKRINLLCTAPTIIDYAAAGSAQDIQVSASFAVDEQDWNDGNRTFYCFVDRAGGEDLTASIAVPHVAPAVTPAP